MKILVKIEDVEVSYEEENYKTTATQDKDYMNLCCEKALLLYSEKLKQIKDISEVEDEPQS